MMMPQHPEWQEEASQKEYDCSIFTYEMLTLMAAKKGKSELRASRIELEASAWQAPRLLVGNDQLRGRIRKEKT